MDKDLLRTVREQLVDARLVARQGQLSLTL